jgi:protein-S-isoprenylcysteine O-methyltransferase Ste14
MMSTADRQKQRKGVNRRRVVLVLTGLPLFFVVFMFLPAGTWAWAKGWLFIVVLVGIIPGVFLCLWRVNPEVVVARSHTHEGTKRWDRILLWFYFPTMWAIVPVAALDDGRFQWSALPWWVCAVGYALLLVGVGITTWAEAVNKFFEPTVRIQTERGHKVIDTGPYALVRHPGYVGGLFMAAGMALSLGSVWALIPAGLASFLLILRTRWEDQTLQAELPGYREFTERVRYKLIPGVW